MLADTQSKTTVTAVTRDLRLIDSLYCKKTTRLSSDHPFKVLAIGKCTLRSTPNKNGGHGLTVEGGTHICDANGKSPVYAE